MVVKNPVQPKQRTGVARSANQTEFKVWCNINGYVVGIEPKAGQPIEGKCLGLSTVMDASGLKITEIVMQTQDLASCTWKKVGGVWVCV
jgi:hypothetical protein